MSRVIKPLPEGGGASRRTPPSDGAAAGKDRAHLTVVRPGRAPYQPLHRGMWHDDPIADPIRYTTLDDWPTDQQFEPLIASALAAGNRALAAQLEADRAFCAEARAALSRPVDLSRDSTA